jgi:glucose-6-phosphate isomerase
VRDGEGLREDARVSGACPPAPFDPGLDVRARRDPLGFEYGPGVFGPAPELRPLDAIRSSLRDPACVGPDPVYAIAMDVGCHRHRAELLRRHLLFGVVTYASGRLGAEPVRSQGHVHRIAPHSGWSPPELYEIWSGRALVYLQEHAADDPGRCLAIEAGPGEKVVVPPGWAHATVSADLSVPLTFGAWCDREYGFEYGELRARKGLAWFPLLDGGGRIAWQRNPRYAERPLVVRPAREYAELGLRARETAYRAFERDPESVQWVSEPARVAELWPGFEP